jgi:cyclic pyranopterin phosphate synthase
MKDSRAMATVERVVIAQSKVLMQPATLLAIIEGKIPKGDVLATARIAGIMAAKRTAELIPLCHPVLLSSVSVELTPDEAASCIVITASVRSVGQTGVVMEAMMAASVAALTIFDMTKGRDRGMTITDIQLVEKRGGHTGDWQRNESSSA